MIYRRCCLCFAQWSRYSRCGATCLHRSWSRIPTWCERTFELGFNRDGRLLNTIIGDELTDRLRDAATEFNQPMPMLLTMRPWMAATTISMGAIMDMEVVHNLFLLLLLLCDVTIVVSLIILQTSVIRNKTTSRMEDTNNLIMLLRVDN